MEHRRRGPKLELPNLARYVEDPVEKKKKLVNSREGYSDMISVPRNTLAIKCNPQTLSGAFTNMINFSSRFLNVKLVDDISECLVFSSIHGVLYVVDDTGLTDGVCKDLCDFISGCGRCLIVLCGDMSRSLLSNVNYLIEQFGICGNPDSVVDCVYTESLTPDNATAFWSNDSTLSFVYPRGCTLTVQDPAKIVAVSSRNSYPVSQPVCACTLTSSDGRLLVVGSTQLLSDDSPSSRTFITSVLIPFFLEETWTPPDPIPPDSLPPYRLIPDLLYMTSMFDDLKEPEIDPGELPFDLKPRWPTIDHDLIAEVAEAYETLQVPLAPLTMDCPNVSNFLLPELRFYPIVVEDESIGCDSDKLPLLDLDYILQGSPPLHARSEEEIEYILSSSGEDPKQRLLTLTAMLLDNSKVL